jgi:arsenate reductase
MKQLYGIDMEKIQRPKLLSEIPAVDVVISMGCNVTCPYLPCKHRQDRERSSVKRDSFQ